jgi:hypothetical protein
MVEEVPPDRLLRWMQVLQIFAVPLAIVVVGGVINSTIAASQTRADYVQLAVGSFSSRTPTQDELSGGQCSSELGCGSVC